MQRVKNGVHAGLEEIIAKRFGQPLRSRERIAPFLTLLRLQDGRSVLCKEHAAAATEGKMLSCLGEYLPCAEVYYYDEQLLLMEYLDDRCRVDEAEAAATLAQLHRQRFDYFGFGYDTTIGPHRQVNTPSRSWIDFFTHQRVMQMADACYAEGRMEAALLQRIETFAHRFGDYLTEPEHPSLLHGDIWSGNVLCKGGRATYIDPAIYYGHYEIELAFITLFNTFSSRFFESYSEQVPIEAEFFSTRKDIYNLYPLLVHIRSFGGSYVTQLERTLKRFGF